MKPFYGDKVRIGLDDLAFSAYSMRMKARDVIKALKDDGWYEARSKGGHLHLKHPTKPGLVTVPVHGSYDIKLMVLRSIEKQSGVNLRKEK